MDWPSCVDPDEPGCPYCESRDGEAHDWYCPMFAPVEESHWRLALDEANWARFLGDEATAHAILQRIKGAA